MGTHEPLDVHAHVADDGIGAQHFFLDALAFTKYHHVSAPFEVRHGVRNARHFFAKGVVQRKEVVYL